MPMSHLHRLAASKPDKAGKGGYRLAASKSSFSALKGMSLYKLVLFRNGIREPHWHANADELGYCLKGKALVSFYGNNNQKESFAVNAGETFYIPSGALHCIENIGKGNAELILQFSHEEPEDFALSTTLGMFSNAVLGNTWNVSEKRFSLIKRPIIETFAGLRKGPAASARETEYVSPHRFDLESSSPLVQNLGGSAKMARHNTWPILKRQALYSLELTGKGMREPHWHPETAEMGYVHQGKGRMSILSPSGEIDTYEMRAGDVYFIPKAYPHHIENLSRSRLHLLIFFDQNMPGDIGFTGSVKSFSDQVLTAMLPSAKNVFEKLPVYFEDLFIVGKRNPLD